MRLDSLWPLVILQEMRLSKACNPLASLIQELIQKDDFPKLRLASLFKAMSFYDESVKGGNARNVQNAEKMCRFFLDCLDQYLDVAHKKLRRNRRIGKTFRELIHSTEASPKSGLPDQALLKLIAMDPAWLFDSRIQKKIEDKIQRNDKLFVKQLGQALNDSKAKCYRSEPKGKMAKNVQMVLKDIAKKTGQNPLSLSLSVLVDRLSRHPKTDPDNPLSREYLKKYIKRHTLKPSISQELDS